MSFQLGARSDRVCDGLPENGRMRAFFTPMGWMTSPLMARAIPGLRRGSTSVCFALRDPACLRPCQRTRNRALGYFPGHHDRVFHARRGERLDLQTGQMESQDCLITLEIYEPLRQVGKDIYCVDGEWEKTAFKRRMTVVKLSSGDLVLHSPIPHV